MEISEPCSEGWGVGGGLLCQSQRVNANQLRAVLLIVVLTFLTSHTSEQFCQFRLHQSLRGDNMSPQRERRQHSQARMFISRQQKLQSHKRPTVIRKCFCNILLSEGSTLKVPGDSGNGKIEGSEKSSFESAPLGLFSGKGRHTNEGSDFPILRKYRARTFWVEIRLTKKRKAVN